jgi:hypothetical protein
VGLWLGRAAGGVACECVLLSRLYEQDGDSGLQYWGASFAADPRQRLSADPLVSPADTALDL